MFLLTDLSTSQLYCFNHPLPFLFLFRLISCCSSASSFQCSHCFHCRRSKSGKSRFSYIVFQHRKSLTISISMWTRGQCYHLSPLHASHKLLQLHLNFVLFLSNLFILGTQLLVHSLLTRVPPTLPFVTFHLRLSFSSSHLGPSQAIQLLSYLISSSFPLFFFYLAHPTPNSLPPNPFSPSPSKNFPFLSFSLSPLGPS